VSYQGKTRTRVTEYLLFPGSKLVLVVVLICFNLGDVKYYRLSTKMPQVVI